MGETTKRIWQTAATTAQKNPWLSGASNCKPGLESVVCYKSTVVGRRAIERISGEIYFSLRRLARLRHLSDGPWDAWGPLLAGGELHIMPGREELQRSRSRSMLASNRRLSILFSPTSCTDLHRFARGGGRSFGFSGPESVATNLEHPFFVFLRYY